MTSTGEKPSTNNMKGNILPPPVAEWDILCSWYQPPHVFVYLDRQDEGSSPGGGF